MARVFHPYLPKPCLECGADFLRDTPRAQTLAKFCCPDCGAAWRRREVEGRNPDRLYLDGDDFVRIVALRGQGFGYPEIAKALAPRAAVITTNAVYKMVYRYAPELLGAGVPKACVVCGVSFTASRHDALYCSETCRNRGPDRVAYGRDWQRYHRDVQAGRVPKRNHQRRGSPPKPQRLEGSAVLSALQKARERRLEYSITGVWR